MKTKNKKIIIILSIAFISVIISITWFIGWSSTEYDTNDKDIGKYIVINTPIISIENIPSNMAGDFISEKYDFMLWTVESWINFKPYFLGVKTNEVNCKEKFKVENVFYIVNHGLLHKAFKEGPMKFYVLSSENMKPIIYSGLDYEKHSHIYNANSVYNCENTKNT